MDNKVEELVIIEEPRTLRGVWVDWKNEVVNKALDSWEAIKEICKASFQLFKKPLIALIEGTYEWLKAVILGVIEIIVALLSVILITFSKTLVGVLEVFFNWIKTKIEKW